MRFPISLRPMALPLAATLIGLSSLTAYAQTQTAPALTPEGRATVQVPIGSGAAGGGPNVTFERERIKRTVPLDPRSAITDGRWDLLYTVAEPSGQKSAYFDWDSDNLYIAWESPAPEDVRFDLDGTDDGFLRGADNLRIQVSKPPAQTDDATPATPTVTAELWDATKNSDRPVSGPAPLPINAIRAVSGKTADGNYVVMVAIGKSELAGFPRIAGENFGLRIESGPPLSAPDGTTILSNKPLIHLKLADRVEAKTGDLHISLKILSAKELVPGDGLRAVLEAKNEGPDPINVTRLFVRGSQASQAFVDTASFTGLVMPPGMTTKRELKSIVAPASTVGTQVITGGAEWQPATAGATPTVVAALASFDRVEPYYISIAADRKAIQTSSERFLGGSKVVTVSIHSRVTDTVRAELSFKLPLGWSVDGGDGTERVVVLHGAGDVAPIRFKVQVPAATPAGQYVLEATATIEERVYSANAVVSVEAAPPPPAPKK